MSANLDFRAVDLPESTQALRQEVRDFIAQVQPQIPSLPDSNFDAASSKWFSQQLGAKGWIGMTWPTDYGGGGRSFLDRFVVTEELIAAGLPVGFHWIADRQSGAVLLSYGSEQQKREILPQIIKGEVCFCIGMSEPNSGSDLAAARCSAKRSGQGWLINGTKLWTTGAHQADYMIALVRTEAAGDNRHAGFSQFLIDLKTPGVEIRSIQNLAGNHTFNEVVFTDFYCPGESILGKEGNGWEQTMSELAFERSGPERILSAYRVLVELLRELKGDVDDRQAEVIGKISAHIIAMRRMSISVALMLEEGKNPALEASVVKDLGNSFEKTMPELLRLIAPENTSERFQQTLKSAILHAPSFTLRGGTREILRGVIARGLGLR